jgi:hypothetical protein
MVERKATHASFTLTRNYPAAAGRASGIMTRAPYLA